MAPMQVEGVDLDLLGADAEADAAGGLLTGQDQPQAGLVEVLAEYPPRPRGLEPEHPLEVLAHHVDAQRQQRLEVGFARGAEAPVHQSMRPRKRSARNAS